MTTRTFTPDQLNAIGVPDDMPGPNGPAIEGAAYELHREQIDTRRWVSVHALVFRAPDDGKAYRVTYEQGLTEHQDGLDPWNYQTSVTATEVVQRAVTVQQWQDATVQPEPASVPPEPVLSEAERAFLTFALDLAFDKMVSDDGFTDDDNAAYDSLRKLAGGES